MTQVDTSIVLSLLFIECQKGKHPLWLHILLMFIANQLTYKYDLLFLRTNQLTS